MHTPTMDIFQPLQFGDEIFHPRFYDENSFVMDWSMKAGGFVPPHKHVHMDEHFLITKGEINFNVNGEKIIKSEGEELFLTKGTPHSIKNKTKENIGLTVTYTPCADVHRMFEIFVTMDNGQSGAMTKALKYFYIYPRMGWKEFSLPHPHIANVIIQSIVNVYGKISGWDKMVEEVKGFYNK